MRLHSHQQGLWRTTSGLKLEAHLNLRGHLLQKVDPPGVLYTFQLNPHCLREGHHQGCVQGLCCESRAYG